MLLNFFVKRQQLHVLLQLGLDVRLSTIKTCHVISDNLGTMEPGTGVILKANPVPVAEFQASLGIGTKACIASENDPTCRIGPLVHPSMNGLPAFTASNLLTIHSMER